MGNKCSLKAQWSSVPQNNFGMQSTSSNDSMFICIESPLILHEQNRFAYIMSIFIIYSLHLFCFQVFSLSFVQSSDRVHVVIIVCQYSSGSLRAPQSKERERIIRNPKHYQHTVYQGTLISNIIQQYGPMSYFKYSI